MQTRQAGASFTRLRRPRFTPAIAERICELLMEGVSMREIARSPDMPSRMTMLRRLASDPDFARRTALARSFHLETVGDAVLELVDGCDMSNYRMVKWQFDQMRWKADKFDAKKYWEY